MVQLKLVLSVSQPSIDNKGKKYKTNPKGINKQLKKGIKQKLNSLYFWLDHNSRTSPLNAVVSE